MPVRSAGLLLYRVGGEAAGTPADGQLQVWIAHMGGPFWARKDARAWSIPKGEYTDQEDPLAAALREFGEEMGSPAPAAEYVLLEQLAISPQCGFSSTVEGNALTRDEQIAKLALVVETAQEVWGFA